MHRVLDEPASDETWGQIAPLLDAAMAKLSEIDRHAVVLRFFDGKSMSEVGAALGATEEAAKKRVSRALEKLQQFFAKRGVHSTTTIIGVAISTNSVQAVPLELVKSVVVIAVAKGTMASVSTLTLAKGALKAMAWTRAKKPVVAGVVLLLLAAVITTVTVKEISYIRVQKIFARFNQLIQQNGDPTPMLNAAPAIIVIQPSNRPSEGTCIIDNGRLLGLGQTMREMLQSAYLINESHIAADTPLPQGRYDYISTVPNGQAELQREITKKFGLVGRRETRNADVFILKVQNRSPPGLRPSSQSNSTVPSGPDNTIRINGQPMVVIANLIDFILGTPVIDQTGLTGNFDLQLKFKVTMGQPVDQGAFKQAVLDQLGLQLVPSVQPVEMFVVKKTK
jgi:uncharacterized protein (TIGR03435 family)